MPTPEARLARAEAQVSRLRWYVIVLVGLVVLLGLVIPFGVIRFQQEATQDATVQITCQGFDNQIEMLQALRALEHRLGVPVDFRIPVLPEDCV